MSWRVLLTLALLAAAIVSGWSVWKHRPAPAAGTEDAKRSDYLLHDFEVVVLDRAGHESFTLRAPFLERRTQGQQVQSLGQALPGDARPGRRRR